jgi:hypothetical protein
VLAAGADAAEAAGGDDVAVDADEAGAGDELEGGVAGVDDAEDADEPEVDPDAAGVDGADDADDSDALGDDVAAVVAELGGADEDVDGLDVAVDEGDGGATALVTGAAAELTVFVTPEATLVTPPRAPEGPDAEALDAARRHSARVTIPVAEVQNGLNLSLDIRGRTTRGIRKQSKLGPYWALLPHCLGRYLPKTSALARRICWLAAALATSPAPASSLPPRARRVGLRCLRPRLIGDQRPGPARASVELERFVDRDGRQQQRASLS